MDKSKPVLLGCRSNVNCNNERGFEVRVKTLDSIQANQHTYSNTSVQNNNDINYWRRSSSQEDLTVSVQNLCKSYEKGKPILSKLCMNVEKGTIYGLLGNSGCGKTTLLSCIIGLIKKWDSGDIYLFNRRLNGIPGRRVGYMPQDISLHDQISVRETIEYYGRLYGMANSQVEKQWLWLVDFLQLPSKFMLIKNLSGGQKRRVSLAITLVHSPELLILDEPTVGLDPLLRESIWEHLFKMVKTNKTTVIVTTHYIEEAKCSNRIGVMRKGRLLVEDSPQSLLQQYDCDLLEQVVLKLCRKDEKVLMNSNNSSINSHDSGISELVVVDDKKIKGGKNNSKSCKNSYNVYERFQENWRLSSQRRSSINMSQWDNANQEEKNGSTFFGRIYALSCVIWLMFMRHPVFMTLVLFLPTIQIILTLAVLGTHPKDLQFGVVNNDFIPSYDFCFKHDYDESSISRIGNQTTLCDFRHSSCSLITELSVSGTLTLIPLNSTELAREMVLQGDLWGFFTFPSNYSQHLENLVVSHKFAENETLEGSRVFLAMDMSHYLGAAIAIRDTFQAYENFARKLAISCGLDPREFQLPIMYRDPVYGTNQASYHDYVIPIIILSVLFEIPMLVTAILFINDRKQGILDRSRVAGLYFKEVMCSHFITQGSVIIGQTAICTVVLHVFYHFRVAGSFVCYIFLCVLCGLCGESLGLFLGVIFNNEVEAVMFGIFICPILLLYEGALWPLEGMNSIVRHISYASPTTLIVESLRGVIYKGVGLEHSAVWPGISTMIGWTLLFWVVSVAVFIRKQK